MRAEFRRPPGAYVVLAIFFWVGPILLPPPDPPKWPVAAVERGGA